MTRQMRSMGFSAVAHAEIKTGTRSKKSHRTRKFYHSLLDFVRAGFAEFVFDEVFFIDGALMIAQIVLLLGHF